MHRPTVHFAKPQKTNAQQKLGPFVKVIGHCPLHKLAIPVFAIDVGKLVCKYSPAGIAVFAPIARA
jgi:hypothetical protein